VQPSTHLLGYLPLANLRFGRSWFIPGSTFPEDRRSVVRDARHGFEDHRGRGFGVPGEHLVPKTMPDIVMAVFEEAPGWVALSSPRAARLDGRAGVASRHLRREAA